MAHLIDKAAVVAEIDRRIASLESIGSENYLHDNYPNQFAMLMTLKSLKFSINTLEVKEVDLEKEVNAYMVDEMKFLSDEVGYDTLSTIAKHFFELGLKVAQKG